MHWADKFAQEIINSGDYKPYWVDDMKTPSGRVHIGSIRTLLTHFLVYQGLIDAGQDATFSYVFEDQDPFDKVPSYLSSAEWESHLGKPLGKVPSPEPGYESYAKRWAQEYIDIFNTLGVNPKIIWGAELYTSGKMNDLITLCMDNREIISGIYKELYGEAKPKDWYPFNIECEQCGKIDTTNITSWDGKTVSYRCDKETYTPSCGYEGNRSPFDGAGKMPWKVEWPCKWQAIGVTVEGAGKDHMSEGGSHDFAKLMCHRLLEYPVPYAVSHEFFLTGGKKMSSSKGVGSSAKEVAEVIPPHLMRFAIVRVRYNRAINFDLNGDTIPDLYDAFDEAADAFWNNGDEKLARIFELSQINETFSNSVYLPRFRDLITVVQDPKQTALEYATDDKGSELTTAEKDILAGRVSYLKIWLKDYAPDDVVVRITQEIPSTVASLTDEQKTFLAKVAELLEQEWKDPQDLQQVIYQTSKDMSLYAKKAFGAIYQALLGKSHGPQAAWFLLENKDKAIERLRSITKE